MPAVPTRRSNTTFKPGTPKHPNSGRRKGQKNKTTVLLREAILEAAVRLGRDGKGKDGLVGFLQSLAIKEKAVYARLLEKVLPLQVSVQDKSAPIYTASEAVERLKERGLPIPPALLSLASSGTVIENNDQYLDEISGVGIEGLEPAEVPDANEVD